MDLWIFDNDGTLYDDGEAYRQFRKLLLDYTSTLKGIGEIKKQQLIQAVESKVAVTSTLFALHRENGLDFDAMIAATYLQVKLDECHILSPDLERRKVLDSIKTEKVVFTNNVSAYALRVLNYVGLDACFSRIIGIQETAGLSKPDRKAFQFVHDLFPEYDRIFFCDDKRECLDTACEFGWHTIWYHPFVDSNVDTGPHRVIRSFNELVI